jgi:hypothetical protein
MFISYGNADAAWFLFALEQVVFQDVVKFGRLSGKRRRGSLHA